MKISKGDLWLWLALLVLLLVVLKCEPASAAWLPGGAAGGNNFSAIGANIIESIRDLPGLVSGLAYLLGLLLGVLAILKLRDHVENPHGTPLKDGLIRLAAGGALFALPVVFEAMKTTIGTDGAGVAAPMLTAVTFGMGG